MVAPDLLLERLKRLHPKSIDLSLGRIERLLARLGHPEHRFPPAIHVAGTNGKGSTVAFLRAFAEAAGYRVHVYTSPHLVRFNERIRLAGRLIEDAQFSALLEECERVNGEEPITLFEITTAAAFLAFAREPADLLLLETGLGGRLDATNIVARPLGVAITPISLDHMQYLGDTVAKIAFEKAGILKAGVPATIGPQVAEAMAVLQARADDLRAPLAVWGQDFRAEASPSGMRFESAQGQRDLPPPGLIGPHQIPNAATAIACVERQQALRIPADAVARGLRAVEWPARMQRLAAGPLVDLLPAGGEIWLDGGHNPGAGEAIAATLDQWRGTRPVHMVVGMLENKDARGYFAPFRGRVARVFAVPIPGEPCHPPEALAAFARDVGLDAETAADAASAIRAVPAEPSPRMLLAGSLYFAGKILAENR